MLRKTTSRTINTFSHSAHAKACPFFVNRPLVLFSQSPRDACVRQRSANALAVSVVKYTARRVLIVTVKLPYVLCSMENSQRSLFARTLCHRIYLGPQLPVASEPIRANLRLRNKAGSALYSQVVRIYDHARTLFSTGFPNSTFFIISMLCLECD